MKISFKKFISSALATVMAMACVGVVNVSSVFAAFSQLKMFIICIMMVET